MTRLVLLAGPSGSGKSRLARRCDALVLRLDDFYFDADHPGLPLTEHGFIDWDDARTWDADAAVAALVALRDAGRCTVPEYSIAQSRRTGVRELSAGGRSVVIAEGIFAIELGPIAERAGVRLERLYLDRPRTLVTALRFRRDVAQHRKSLPVLLRRNLDLFRAQPALRAKAIAAGFRPVTMRGGIRLLTGAA